MTHRRSPTRATVRFAAVGAMAILGSPVSCSPKSDPSEPLPNVVVISIDTLRADHTSVHGYGRETTKGLAAVASQGTVLEAAYAPTPSTAPTHASLFTGTYPLTHGLRKNGRPLAAEAVTLAEVLSSRGYQTVGVASSFVLDRQFGFNQGFSDWLDDFEPDQASVIVDEWLGFSLPRGFDRRADATTNRALRWLWLERDPAVPFFLFVHYFDPHAPYDPPAGFEPDYPIGPESGFETPQRYGPVSRLQFDQYDAEIAFTDREVGRLLEGIDDLELAREALIVVTADHGEGLMDHGIWRHGLAVYEEAVRVPLIFRWDERIQSGHRIAEPVELVDVMPTLLDLLSIDEPLAAFDGRSFAEALRGGAPLPEDRPVFLYRGPYEPGIVDGIEVAGELFAVRQGRWKLIQHSATAALELYDLDSDPGETRNLHASNPEELARLSRLLASWRSGTDSPDETPEISTETRRALEALGYTE